jgi:aconitate hydratase
VPSDSKLLPYRSNVPHLAKFSFCKVDDQFYHRAIENGGGFIVGGDNYGQGSSREHAALVPNYLKIKAIFALSFARIHRSNLINNGILPLIIDQVGYDFFNDQDEYVLLDVKDAVENGTDVTVQNINTKETIVAKLSLAPREKVMILQGGLLNAIKELGGDF